jgi:hypothetical protein
MVKKLPAYQLAYILSEELNGEETADIRAMNRLMAQGLILPDLDADRLKLTLSPLGRVVQRLAADVEIPANAIKEYKKSERARIDDAVQRKITALLAHDPDNPEDDEALDRWARHGGPAPLSEARKKEVSSKFVRGVLDEIGDDPEMRQEFVDTIGRIAARNGDDQKA